MNSINRISIKLGLLFFVFILVIESMLFLFLYKSVVTERTEHEMHNLLSRGNSHRKVLEAHFDQETISHVALMESEAETAVVITDSKHQVIASSNGVFPEMAEIITDSVGQPYSEKGELLEKGWNTERYLATESPIIIEGQTVGFVYMFLDTMRIRIMIDSLTRQFLVMGLLSFLLSAALVIYLSRFLTAPIKKIQRVTERISMGHHDTKLDTDRSDELGDLARAIDLLSTSLYTLKKDRNEFLSSISHELRTPLTYLKGYADIAKRKSTPQQQRDEYLSIIQEEADHVALLIRDLFDLAKMDENAFDIKKENILLNDFLKRMAGKFKPVYAMRSVTLNWECNEQIETAIDPIRFEQVIGNLLDNALKHSSEGSTVSMLGKKEKDTVIISVSDEGEGIPETEIPFIWDRLYRVDKSRSRSTGGTGLGLAIVRGIVEKHGGEISVKSKLSKGTTFIIKLKAGEEHE